MARTLRSAVAAMAFSAIAATAAAQQYGQWTWDARVQGRQRAYTFTESDRVTSELKESDGVLTLGLNGYFLHPAVAAFRLSADTGLTRRGDATAVDSRRVGYRGDLRIFPTGVYPVHVYVSRQDYSYSGESPVAGIGSIPEDITTIGARIRVRSGPLTGLVARSERSRIGLLGPQGGTETQLTHLADWAGGRKGWQRHYRLERQARTFAVSGYKTDDISFLADESYRSNRWQWASSSQLIRRDWSSDAVDGSSLTALRMQNRLLRTLSSARTFELQHSLGLTLASAGSQSHTLGARYSLSTRGHFTLSPFATIGFQSSDALRVFAPAAGLSATWTLTKGALDTVVSGSAASLILNSSGNGQSTRDTTVNGGAGGSLSFRPRRGMNLQIETYVSRNELRRSGETLSASDVLIPVDSIGTEDRMQARVTLGRKWRPFGLHFYVDWLTQEASGELRINPYSAETLSSLLQVTLRDFSVSGSAGSTTLVQNHEQELRFLTAAARMRLIRSASLVLSHRAEKRVAVGEPEVDGTRSEGGLSLQIGSYSIEPQVFLSTQRSDGAERTQRGFTVTIARGFGGYLPFVTGVQRRGVVR